MSSRCGWNDARSGWEPVARFGKTALSKDLKRRGWTFVGPTTIDASMQAMGLVNDHLDGCFARPRAEKARRAFLRP